MEEYCVMCFKVGLLVCLLVVVKVGLLNFFYVICVCKDDKLIGMGCVIGDGGCNFEVVDIVVLFEY